MSARTTAADRRGRPDLLFLVLLAFCLGAVTALWPAQVTVGFPTTPSLGAVTRAVDVRHDGDSPVLPTPVHLGIHVQHHAYGYLGDSPWQDVAEPWSPPQDRLASTQAPPATVRPLALTGPAMRPHPRGPPESVVHR